MPDWCEIMERTQETKKWTKAVTEAITSAIPCVLEYPAKNGRVDAVAQTIDGYKVGFEFKGTYNDLIGKWGHNFDFPLNYLVVPSTLIVAACRYLQRKERDDVGIIAFDIKNGRKRVTLVRGSEYNTIGNGVEIGQAVCALMEKKKGVATDG